MISNLPFQLTSYKGGDGGDSAAGAAAVDQDDEAFIIAAVAWFRIDDPLLILSSTGGVTQWSCFLTGLSFTNCWQSYTGNAPAVHWKER